MAAFLTGVNLVSVKIIVSTSVPINTQSIYWLCIIRIHTNSYVFIRINPQPTSFITRLVTGLS